MAEQESKKMPPAAAPIFSSVVVAAAAHSTAGLPPFTLRARGGDPSDPDERRRPTDPVGLSRSILHVLDGNPYVNVQSVGPIAEKIVMRAFRLAAEITEKRTKGSVLVVRQSEYTAVINGKPAQGVCTRIFPIEIQHAL